MSELTARWYGHTLVIGADERLPWQLVEALPRERDRHTVLLAGVAPKRAEQVARLISRELPKATSIRLACSAAGVAGLAQQLADQLGIEVVAPMGPTMLVEPGSLFVLRRPRAATWCLHRPSHRPRGIDAPRHPAPHWQVTLPRQPFFSRHGLVARDLPAGFWLHRPQRGTLATDDPAFAVEVDADRVAVVVGQPDREPPSPRRLYRWLARLPLNALERLVLMPYGPWGALLDTVAERLSNDLHVVVGRTAGLPVRFGGTTYHAPVDAAGRLGARPAAQTMTYITGDPIPRIDTWISPTTGRLEQGHAVEDVTDGWVLEIVRSGYWLREADARTDDDVRLRPAEGSVFLVDAPGETAHDLARRLVLGLPADVRAALRFEQRADQAPARQADLPAPPPHADLADPGTAEQATAGTAAAPEAAPPSAPAHTEKRAALPRRAAALPPAARLLRSPTAPTGPAAVPAAEPATPDAGTDVPALEVASAPIAAPVGRRGAPVPSPTWLLSGPHSPAMPPRRTRLDDTAAKPSSLSRRTTEPAVATTPALPVSMPVGTAPEPVAPLPPLRRQPGAVPGPAPRPSSVHEQRRVREHLGAEYDVLARDVAELLVRLPGIRPGVDESADAVIADLVAVAAMLRPERAGTDVALRACLLSGLNRLPVAPGPVRALAPADPLTHHAGEILSNPGLLRAGTWPPVGDRHDEYVIYSITGRRPGVLSDRDEVLFAPGTVFEALETDHGLDGVRVVLLREVAGPEMDSPPDEQVLASLRAAAARRR